MITDFNQLDLNKQYSYADYLTWTFNDRVELLKGWIKKMSPAPLDGHQRISNSLSFELTGFFRKKPCQVRVAPYDVRLLDNKKSTDNKDILTVVQPDICVICDPAKIDRRGCLGAPDWIIEILSPGNSKLEMQDKFELYEQNGVREYWIVQPEHEDILAFALENGKYQLTKIYVKGDKVSPTIFPELVIDTEDVF
jgi:Uma2 family endonuclease